MHEVAVLGAGIVGVSTAINVQKKFPTAKVRLISDRFDQDTTSWGAGGVFVPEAVLIHGLNTERLRKWVKNSWEYYSSLASSENASVTGMQFVSGYCLYKNEPEIPVYAEFVNAFRKMTKKEINRLKFQEYQYGFFVTTIITTVRKYYPWLLKRFLEKGGEIEQKHITSLNEFVGKYDVVVNCTGLGSRKLLGDNSVYSSRGQIVRVRAPWIKHFVYTDDHTYMLPNEDLLALGGIRQDNNYNMNNSKEDTEDILRRCQKLFPAVKGAKIDHVWTGLRPTRTPPRVESEILKLSEGNLKVVHNYGHGANGIVLSWGSSLEAADLVESCLKSTNKL